eukprot:6195535-Pleurochrysis_carterae.AAC.3
MQGGRDQADAAGKLTCSAATCMRMLVCARVWDAPSRGCLSSNCTYPCACSRSRLSLTNLICRSASADPSVKEPRAIVRADFGACL